VERSWWREGVVEGVAEGVVVVEVAVEHTRAVDLTRESKCRCCQYRSSHSVAEKIADRVGQVREVHAVWAGLVVKVSGSRRKVVVEGTWGLRQAPPACCWEEGRMIACWQTRVAHVAASLRSTSIRPCAGVYPGAWHIHHDGRGCRDQERLSRGGTIARYSSDGTWRVHRGDCGIWR
jgi:hypothetical protein